MDLASATDELYAGSPEDFVERRKALAAAARAAKDRALATTIGKLRRPTRSAWLVNVYAREAPEELTGLLDLGAALQAAQQQLSVTELRRLSGERQQTLAAATRTAIRLGEDHGYTATEAVRQEVTQTLQAALADPEVAEQVRAGTVTEAHAYGGFGVFGLAEAQAAPASADEATPGDPDDPAREDSQDAEDGGDAEDAKDAKDAKDAEEDRAAEQRAAAEQRLHDAEEALSTAADEAEEATEHADELADRVEALRRELSDAEESETEARQVARSARKAVTERQAEVEAAREAYEAL